jgi:hypothetical protein
MRITCYQCHGAMDVPDQVGQLGGVFSCPHCRTVVTIAPTAAPVVSGAKAKPSDNRAGAVLLAVLGAGALFSIFPLAGLLLGIACLGWGIYVLKKGGPSPLQLVFRESTKTSAMAAGTIAIGLFFTTCGAMGFKKHADEEAELERVARENAEAAEKRRTEAEERRKQADEAVAQGSKALADGKVEEAQTLLAKAQELDPEASGAEGLSTGIKDELHRRALATLPERVAKIEGLVRDESWKEAGKECKAAKAIDAAYRELEGACAPAEQQLVLIERREAVANAIEVAGNADKCDTPLALSEAWEALKKIPADDPSHKKAQQATAKLEKCRKKVERAFDKGIRDLMITQREAYVETLDRAMLESGFDATATVSGKHKDKLRIEWVLMGRATAHQMAHEGGILAGAEKIGFKRVTFTDGYFESFYWDLSPQSEDGGGKAALRGMGLDEPLKL